MEGPRQRREPDSKHGQRSRQVTRLPTSCEGGCPDGAPSREPAVARMPMTIGLLLNGSVGQHDQPYTTPMATDPNRTRAIEQFVRRLRHDLPERIVDLRLF